MPARPLAIHLVTQRLDDSVLLAEPLLFPPVALCHDAEGKLKGAVRTLVTEAASALPPTDWHRHALAGPPAQGTLRLTVDPPRRQTDWSEPLDCAFDYVWWTHAGGGAAAAAVVAYFPALEIEVIARSQADLEANAPEHVRGALRRSAAAESLYRVALLRRVRETTLSAAEVVVDLPSPRRRRADAEAERDRKQRPVIEQVGRVLSDDKSLDPAYEADEAVARVAEALVGRAPRSVLLVGPPGVGKTAVVRELVRRRDSLGLADVPFWATGGARLVAGMSGFGMWQERCARLCREAAAAKAVVHLGNLVELMEVGQGELIGQGIAGFLKPHLIRGDLLAIAECTPEQLTLVERRDPHLLDAFQTVRVEEPPAEQGRRVLAARAVAVGRGGLVRLSDAGLATLDRQHRRYAGYSAFPGRPLGFLQNLVHDVFSQHAADGLPGGRVTLGPAEVTAAFARQTGLPPFLLDDAVPLDAAVARDAFARRVIGQPEAVDLVTDLIATVKAGLSRPRRPIASLLFIGPTGVGKTEMAKALAEFFFASAERMTRFDMSEYGSAADVQRLVGGIRGVATAGGGGSAASAGEGLLTAKVREQPFSVVLLDEVEKAHPLLFDLLLQVLGEGRLTDAAGRVADFTNAVVVMTSNLGAEGFQRGGFGLRDARTGPDAGAHFTAAVRSFLRPELFNRIDRIVPFLPLDAATVEKIVRRELDQVARRDGLLLRGVAFAPDDEVVRHLAAAGYDRTYGARPLKRLIERDLLVPMADGINGYGDGHRLTADVAVRDGKLAVTVRAVAPTTSASATGPAGFGGVGGGAGAAPSAAATGWADVAEGSAALRRTVQRLNRSTALVAVQNELYALRRAEQLAQERAARNDEPPPYDARRSRRIGRLAAVADAAAAVATGAVEAEDAALEHVYGRMVPPPDVAPASRPATVPAARAKLVAMESAFDELLLDLYDVRHPAPDRVTIGLFGDAASAADLARAYLSIVEATAAGDASVDPDARPDVRAWWFRRSEKLDAGRPNLHRVPAGRQPMAAQVLGDRPDDVFGLLMAVRGRHAVATFTGETGTHVFVAGDRQDTVPVYVVSGDPAEFVVPEEILQNGVSPLRKRRTYFRDRATAKDERMSRELRWAGGGLREAVAQAMAAATRKLAMTVLDEESKDSG